MAIKTIELAQGALIEIRKIEKEIDLRIRAYVARHPLTETVSIARTGIDNVALDYLIPTYLAAGWTRVEITNFYITFYYDLKKFLKEITVEIIKVTPPPTTFDFDKRNINLNDA